MKKYSIDIIKLMIPYLFCVLGIFLIYYPHIYLISLFYQKVPLIGLLILTLCTTNNFKIYFSIVTLIFCLTISSNMDLYLEFSIWELFIVIALYINNRISKQNK